MSVQTSIMTLPQRLWLLHRWCQARRLQRHVWRAKTPLCFANLTRCELQLGGTSMRGGVQNLACAQFMWGSSCCGQEIWSMGHRVYPWLHLMPS